MAVTTLQAPPSYLLTTMDTLKGELGISTTSNDDVLFALLTRASNLIATECGRVFGLGWYQETLRGSNSQILGLTHAPLLAVTQVLADQDILDPLDATSGYAIEDAEAGALYRAAGWGASVNLLSWGHEAYGSRYILPGGTQTLRYTVTYWAGYLLPYQLDYLPYDPTAGVHYDTAVPPSTVAVPAVLNTPQDMRDPPPLPGGVEQACLLTCKAWWFTRQRDPSISSQQSADEKQSYDLSQLDSAVLPLGALRLLRDSRKVVR